MLRIVYRLPFFCMALFILLLSQAVPCQAKEISVELVWKLGQAPWVEIDVEQGDYQLVIDSMKREFPVGSSLQLGWDGWTPILRINQEQYQIFKGSVLELKESKPGSLRIKTPQGEDAVYRGGIQLSWQNDHWRLINRVDSEEYLKGVVPIEMSNEWAHEGLEALKAQAVAARTYLVRQTDDGKKMITDSPDIDQAYAGKFVEGEASAAVEATRGEILVDAQSKQPIEALYSSHSGGYTEDAKNVWGTSDTHNVSHPDPYSEGVGGAVAHWRFIISAPLLGSTFGLGPVRNIELDKFPSGRIKNVKMVDGFGQSKTVTGRTFVKTFYPFGQPIKAAAFLGSLFEVRAIVPKFDTFAQSGLPGFLSSEASSRVSGSINKALEGPLLAKILSTSSGMSDTTQPFGVFIFEGQGWGHGVGMSQWGAYHMAQLGYTYKEILSFYYNNTLIQ